MQTRGHIKESRKDGVMGRSYMTGETVLKREEHYGNEEGRKKGS